jgi:tRNA-dihydrouridine synthase B
VSKTSRSHAVVVPRFDIPSFRREGAAKVNPVDQLTALLARPEPLLALAPMQDVTDLPFWTLLSKYGGPDVYYTEYFRVHGTSGLQRHILRSITENPTGRPVIAQMIGNDPVELARIAGELQKHEIAGVDLNLGCPAPVVYRKCAGGGLLRELDRVDTILGVLRAAVSVKFTVKTRVGFDSSHDYEKLLGILARHSPDLVTVHGRTVREMYGPVVHYDLIARAADSLTCPVLANGNVDSAESARFILNRTRTRGLMIGRGAIRNPWIFDQIRQSFRGQLVFVPTGRDLLNYVRELYEAVKSPCLRIESHVQKMKKYLNFLAVGIDPEGQFLHQIRRVLTEADFMSVCERFLDHNRPAFAPSEAKQLAA